MKNKMLILAAALALTSCGGNAQKKSAFETRKTTAEAPDMHTAENALDYTGTYEGTLPAADCPGIRTTLTLRPDATYDLHLKYIDRDTAFDAKGTYTVRENLLTLSPSDGGEQEYYQVEENRLRRLDTEKQPVTGALAEHYVLQKTNE